MYHSMQDHTYFSVVVRTQSEESTGSYLSARVQNLEKIQAAAAEYKANQTGVFTAPIGFTFGFQKLSVDELTSLNATELLSNRTDQAHIEYYFETEYYPTFPVPAYPPNSSESYFSVTAGLIAPVSRGSVTLQSNSVNDAPVINLNVSQYHLSPQSTHDSSQFNLVLSSEDRPGYRNLRFEKPSEDYRIFKHGTF